MVMHWADAAAEMDGDSFSIVRTDVVGSVVYFARYELRHLCLLRTQTRYLKIYVDLKE